MKSLHFIIVHFNRFFFLWVLLLLLLLFVCFTFPLALLVGDLELFLKIHLWILIFFKYIII